MNLNSGQIIVVQGSNILAVVDKPWKILSASILLKSIDEECQPYFVGNYLDEPCYMVELKEVVSGYEWVSLRSQLSHAPRKEYQLANRAVQLATWIRQHQYCGQCGAKTHFHEIESALHCQSCAIDYYPRISPCMMCLITKGDYCLLAQHEKHRGGFYSTLAGFVEAGETVEQTVHREVMEEVGLTVDRLDYFSSQAWPFPHQLMIGFFAQYASGDITIDDDEIVDAQWFHYTNLPEVPPADSLSGIMINTFVQQRKNKKASAPNAEPEKG